MKVRQTIFDALFMIAFGCLVCLNGGSWGHPPSKPYKFPKNPRKPKYRRKPPISLQPRNEQIQSLLFGPRFPAELRVVIYEHVLGDSSRLMHIIAYKDSSGYVGRRRCEDVDFAGPMWQHDCFKSYHSKDPARQGTFDSEDNLLSIILSCHRIYSEALDILYTANTFGVRGACGILEMKSVIPTRQWHIIRNLHVSTLFPSRTEALQTKRWEEREDPLQWSKGCEALEDLHSLLSLRLEIFVCGFDIVEEDVLVYMLAPLTRITAPMFEVEMNVPIPLSVQDRLGRLPFTLEVLERPLDG
ncbi:hypothetical protein K491DRAFT_718128 [Lophiostoma macrostomum CBS 122681]|uniref:DUF7730 domain-containing protein n=1 Tax=Lophiostoma macrostomum CBS 122681 TaxID=1314788 RepID=A0A6A6T436_9PLEO|nr:hypothetical protein K491DRAFT_718128 [Lophiostoma macrostomum CBS 122681]